MSRINKLFLLPALVPLVAGCPNGVLEQVFPEIDLSEEILDFGSLPVLHTKALERTVGNRGRAPLIIHELEIAGEDAGFFSTESLPDNISVGGERAVVVSFRPDEERSYEALLKVHSNDPDDPLVEVPLTGEGLTVGKIRVEPTSIHFGLVGEGAVAIEPFTIHSIGSAPLIVETMDLETGTPEAFSPVGSWRAPATIEPGDSMDLSVAFMPEAGQEDASGAIILSSTDPGRRLVRVPLTAWVNRAPIAVCGDDETIVAAPGDVVTLDGTQSYDPDGHEPLTYEWRVDRRPLTSLTELSDPLSPTPSLELDVAGTWEVLLDVEDSLGAASISPCRTTVRAVAAERLYIEMVWDHPVTDLDLHVLAPGGEIFGPLDCWWGNPDAFGCEHSGDDLAGYGPEWVRLADPDPGTYRVIVRFAKTNGALEPATKATVRVYQYGVLEAEMRRTLLHAGTVWDVLSIDWPSGDVSPVDSVQVAD